MLIDTHAHLYLEHFENDIDLIIQKAMSERVERVYLPNIDSSTIDNMIHLETNYPDFLRSMIGLHPGSVTENFKDELDRLFSRIEQHKYSAIGEIGTDLYWDKTFINEQQETFETQIDWALKYDLPVIIHARESMDLTIDIVNKKQNGRLKGIFHCFSGDLSQANRIINMGFYLGIGGVITYKNSNLPEIVKVLSLDHFVLETDSPYLAPVPFRGKRNESSYLIYIAQKIADIKKVSIEQVASITSKNADRIFPF